MDDKARLLAAYDRDLRTDAETPSARHIHRHGPLRLVTFAAGRGMVTYQNLGEHPDHAHVRALVAAAVEYFGTDPAITRVEWKSRGHDRAPGLHEELLAHGFTARPTESIMVGAVEHLIRDAPLPEGVTLRRIHTESDVRAMAAMQDIAFGDDVSEASADAVLTRLALDDGMQLWVAEAHGTMISAGRLEPVTGTDFAGIWGGATLTQWRGRGIYRALTAIRARAAKTLGKTLIHSDSTEYSRPILERAGLLAVSTTTPYEWRRAS